MSHSITRRQARFQELVGELGRGRVEQHGRARIAGYRVVCHTCPAGASSKRAWSTRYLVPGQEGWAYLEALTAWGKHLQKNHPEEYTAFRFRLPVHALLALDAHVWA